MSASIIFEGVKPTPAIRSPTPWPLSYLFFLALCSPPSWQRNRTVDLWSIKYITVGLSTHSWALLTIYITATVFVLKPLVFQEIPHFFLLLFFVCHVNALSQGLSTSACVLMQCWRQWGYSWFIIRHHHNKSNDNSWNYLLPSTPWHEGL